LRSGNISLIVVDNIIELFAAYKTYIPDERMERWQRLELLNLKLS